MRTASLVSAIITTSVFALAGAAVAGESPAADSKEKSRTAEFIDSEGKRIGKAKLTETPNGILIDATLNSLKRGWHAFHIHERANCDAPDFKGAGGHYHPHGKKHGFKIADGPHAGDLQNIHVPDNGEVRVQAMADGLTLEGGKAALFDSDGSALMIHSGADDYRSQPSGAAGERVACAEIGKQ